jgi:pilus assembly protein CpaE
MRPIVLLGCPQPFAHKVQAAVDDETRAALRRWPEPPMRPGTVSGILTYNPAVVLIGPELSEQDALAVAAEFDRSARDVGVIVVAEQRHGTIDRALAVGVRAVVPPKAEDEAIRLAVTRAAEAAARRSEASSGSALASAARSSGGRVITVTSPKGGAGKTVIATNLAVALAQDDAHKVVLVDLDLQFGDVAYALSLEPRRSLYDAATSGRLDPTALKVYLTHHSGGLYALCAPDDPAHGELVEPEAVTEILQILASGFEFVVVDTGAGLTQHTLAALDASTDAVFIADADVPSIRHLGKVVSALDDVGLTGPSRHFVLNRADARIGVRIADVLESADLRMDIEIPTSRDVPISLSHGVPITISNPKAAMARRMERLAERLRSQDSTSQTNSALKRSA